MALSAEEILGAFQGGNFERMQEAITQLLGGSWDPAVGIDWESADGTWGFSMIGGTISLWNPAGALLINADAIWVQSPDAQFYFATTTGGDATLAGPLGSFAANTGGLQIQVMPGGYVSIQGLPTADPVVTNALWNNAGVLNISAG